MSTKSENDRGFGRVPRGIRVDDLDRGEAVVLLVICLHVNGKTDTSSPSMATIAPLAGMSQSAARRAIRRLERKGRLSVTRSVGRGNPCVYCPFPVPLKPSVQTPVISEIKGSVKTPGFKGEKVASGRQVLAIKPSVQTPAKQIRRRKEEAAAVENESKPEEAEVDTIVMRALADRGVGEPVRSQLACDGQLTVQLIDSLQGTAGILVTRIRESLAKLDKENKSQFARGATQDAEHQARQQAEKRVKAEWAKIDRILGEHDKGAIDSAADQCIEHEQRKITIEVWKEHRLKAQTLRAAVAKRLDPKAFEDDKPGQGPQGGLKFIG